MKTKTMLGAEARAALKEGIDKVYAPVAATIGAKGRNAVYSEWGGAIVTNDGISIARKINPEDPFESLGADLIKQAAEKTNEEAGDGTTTTTILTHAIIEAGLKEIDGGANPVVIRKELEKAKDEVVAKLKEKSKTIDTPEELFNVANISVEDEGIAKTVSESVAKAGKYGSIIVEEGVSFNIEKEEMQGYFWEQGFISPYMITSTTKAEARLEDVPVILSDKGFNLNRELVPILDTLLKQGHKSAFVVADTVEGELLATLINNKLKGVMTVVCVKRPPSVDELEDIAALTGATTFTKEKGTKKIEDYHVGLAKRVIVTRNKTIVIGQASEVVDQRVADMQALVEENKDDENLKSRLAKLTEGVVVIRVGAKTEAERRYLKLKVDDAVGACKAAVEEGIVAGAGAALYEIAGEIENSILKKALTKPYTRILENAGITPDGKYYNVLTGEVSTDLIADGIIDPTKVERCSIENAVSLAGVLLTTESVIAPIEEKVVE